MNPSCRNLFCAGAFLLFSVFCFGQKTTVTVAGGYVGESKPANLTALAEPTSATVDTHGVIYVSDTNNCRIRKIDASGLITTFAGTGLCGFTGDGGPATKAQLSLPRGIVTDAQANVYVADTGNERVRKIDTSGNITTIAGSGTAGFCGDGGPALSGCLNFPEALAIGNTNAGRVLFIADTLNNRIRQVTLGATATISTVAGNGDKGSSGDGGPAVEASLSFPPGSLSMAPARNSISRTLGIAASAPWIRTRESSAPFSVTLCAAVGAPAFASHTESRLIHWATCMLRTRAAPASST